MSDTFEQRFETHFPVQVLVREQRDVVALNASVHAHLRAVQARDAGTAHDAVYTRTCTTQGGFQTE